MSIARDIADPPHPKVVDARRAPTPATTAPRAVRVDTSAATAPLGREDTGILHVKAFETRSVPYGYVTRITTAGIASNTLDAFRPFEPQPRSNTHKQKAPCWLSAPVALSVLGRGDYPRPLTASITSGASVVHQEDRTGPTPCELEELAGSFGSSPTGRVDVLVEVWGWGWGRKRGLGREMNVPSSTGARVRAQFQPRRLMTRSLPCRARGTDAVRG